jgi:solute carrier family 45 protein 1/2/4
MLYYGLVSLVGGALLPILYHFGSSRRLLAAPARYNPLRRVFRHVTLVNIWAGSSWFFAALMFSTLFLTTVPASFVVIALVGICFAVSCWVPYALVCEMILELEHGGPDAAAEGKRVASRALTECEPLMGRSARQRPSGATILGIHNLAIVAPQLVTSVLAAIIFKVVDATTAPEVPKAERRDVVYVFALGGLSAVVAGILAKRVPPTESEVRHVEALEDVLDE